MNVIAIITDELDPGLHNHDRDNPLIDRRDHEFCIWSIPVEWARIKTWRVPAIDFLSTILLSQIKYTIGYFASTKQFS